MDQGGREELHYRALEGDVEGVQDRLEAGDAVSLPDRGGWTPLHFAAQDGHTEVARVLLRGGAAVDARDSFGNTPLWRAVFESRGRGDTIKVLLAAGANPDLPNESGVSPRQFAERIANLDVARFMPPIT
jgi:ankyrin repeat protein